MKEDQSVLHIAPELCLLERLHASIGAGYTPADLNPRRYKNNSCAVLKFDLCTDLTRFSDAKFDIVMHMHVLEHIPCSLEPVLRDTMRILKCGGHLIFALPFVPGFSLENWSPDSPTKTVSPSSGSATM